MKIRSIKQFGELFLIIFAFLFQNSANAQDIVQPIPYPEMSAKEKAMLKYEDMLDYRVNIDSIIKFENVEYNTLPGIYPEEMMFDIYLKSSTFQNKNQKAPVLFFIHGGTWKNGDKAFPLKQIRQILDSGFIFISTNYRLSPNPVNLKDTNRIKFPIHLKDCARAFAHVYQILPFINGDTNRISVMGHSAGGNLAISLATMEEFLGKYNIPLTKIKAAINLDGIGLNLYKLINSIHGSYKKEFMNAFGETGESWVKASPALNFKKDPSIANILLITQDSDFRSQFSFEFYDKLTEAGIKAAIFIGFDFTHNEMITNFCNNETESTTLYTKYIFNFIQEAFKEKNN